MAIGSRPPRILNRHVIKTTPEGAVYIGRPSKWGNPFVVDRDGTREEVITKYRDWLFTSRPDLRLDSRRELRGRDLVCWCSPLPCHGDVLLEVANLAEGDKDEPTTSIDNLQR